MQAVHLVRRFRSSQCGATAVEFAIVSFAFFMLMFGVIEYGMIMMTKVAIESATTQVSRSGSIGVTNATGCFDRVCSIRKLVEEKTYGLVARKSVIVDATVVSDSNTASPPIPDICLEDTQNPYPATCTTYLDNNGAVGYQTPAALGATSIGVAGDLVEIRVTYLWRVLFPIFKSYFGTNGVLVISSSTVIKNEPF